MSIPNMLFVKKILVSVLKKHVGVSKLLSLQKIYFIARHKITKIKKQPVIIIEKNYTASDITEENVNNFIQKLHDSGIPVFFLKSITQYQLAFGVDIEERELFCEQLENCICAETVLQVNGRAYKTAEKAYKISTITGAPIILYNCYESENGRTLFSSHNAVSLYFFMRDGDKLRAVNNNGIVEEFPHSHLSEINPQDCFRIQSWGPIYAFYEHDYDVDIVYTWVDGKDPLWVEKKKIYEDGSTLPATSDSTSRYRNRDEIKYSIRSVLMYADWVRNIYIVTDDQVPDWFVADTNIKIISHREIFDDTSLLPVFNSHAIECQLHKINGLAEHFLYFNDDVLIGRPVSKSTFFTPFGRASKFFYSGQAFVPVKKGDKTPPVDLAANNNASLLKRKFNVFPTLKFKHTPIACLKSTIIDLETQFPEIFQQNCHARFRSFSDYSIISSLVRHYGYYIGKAFPGDIIYDYVNLGNKQYRERLARLRYYRPENMAECFCINDLDNEALQQDEISEEFFSLMEYLYPFPSRVEQVAKI